MVISELHKDCFISDTGISGSYKDVVLHSYTGLRDIEGGMIFDQDVILYRGEKYRILYTKESASFKMQYLTVNIPFLLDFNREVANNSIVTVQ